MADRGKATRKRRRLGLLGAAALVLAGTTGCTPQEVLFIGIPDPTTDQGEVMHSLWQGAWVAAWPVGLLVWGLMIFCIVAYSKRNRPDVPVQTAYNLPIEVLYTVAPLIMVFGLFAVTVPAQNDVLALSDNPDNHVNVVGFRWSWAFNYADENVYDVGTPQDFPTLWLPVDESVRFGLTSPDVIHSFWVPDWLFKMDVIPGKQNQFQVTPRDVGTFAGKCAELCGVNHSHMLFNVKVVPRAEYDAHIADLKARGQIGQLETGRDNRSGVPGPEGQTS